MWPYIGFSRVELFREKEKKELGGPRYRLPRFPSCRKAKRISQGVFDCCERRKKVPFEIPNCRKVGEGRRGEARRGGEEGEEKRRGEAVRRGKRREEARARR